ncbi:uncharacterized protein VTP21DRAFT_664 [Calcarisporiella thermophila]|uniref:uncharacterized protein n=1 Tax=Calcarisporiella thermophila TaxID=911321 RepID=UPI003742B75E
MLSTCSQVKSDDPPPYSECDESNVSSIDQKITQLEGLIAHMHYYIVSNIKLQVSALQNSLNTLNRRQSGINHAVKESGNESSLMKQVQGNDAELESNSREQVIAETDTGLPSPRCLHLSSTFNPVDLSATRASRANCEHEEEAAIDRICDKLTTMISSCSDALISSSPTPPPQHSSEFSQDSFAERVQEMRNRVVGSFQRVNSSIRSLDLLSRDLAGPTEEEVRQQIIEAMKTSLFDGVSLQEIGGNGEASSPPLILPNGSAQNVSLSSMHHSTDSTSPQDTDEDDIPVRNVGCSIGHASYMTIAWLLGRPVFSSGIVRTMHRKLGRGLLACHASKSNGKGMRIEETENILGHRTHQLSLAQEVNDIRIPFLATVVGETDKEPDAIRNDKGDGSSNLPNNTTRNPKQLSISTKCPTHPKRHFSPNALSSYSTGDLSDTPSEVSLITPPIPSTPTARPLYHQYPRYPHRYSPRIRHARSTSRLRRRLVISPAGDEESLVGKRTFASGTHKRALSRQRAGSSANYLQMECENCSRQRCYSPSPKPDIGENDGGYGCASPAAAEGKGGWIISHFNRRSLKIRRRSSI